MDCGEQFMIDLDAIQQARLSKLDHTEARAEAIFASEKVVKSIEGDKCFISSYKSELLGVLPFTPVVYNLVCPRCFDKMGFDKFSALVGAGLVVPMLRAPYSEYDPPVRDFLFAHDHISVQEYDRFRTNSLYQFASKDEHAFGHHAIEEMRKIVAGQVDEEQYRNRIRSLEINLFPYTKEDGELLDLAIRACKTKDMDQLVRLRRRAVAIYQLRTAKVYNASAVVRGSELHALPPNTAIEADAARSISNDMQRMVAEGLGIMIPEDLRIEAYIELVKDYQPRITRAINSIIEASGPERTGLPKIIASINSEIERLKGLKRYKVMEVGIGFYKNNGLLAGGALLAATMGLAGSLFGCATGAVVAAVNVGTKLAKKKPDPALQRLGRTIVRDFQPYSEGLMRGYLGGTAPAISVLSLQRRLHAVSSTGTATVTKQTAAAATEKTKRPITAKKSPNKSTRRSTREKAS
jgi:hypothetical protein